MIIKKNWLDFRHLPQQLMTDSTCVYPTGPRRTKAAAGLSEGNLPFMSVVSSMGLRCVVEATGPALWATGDMPRFPPAPSADSLRATLRKANVS